MPNEMELIDFLRDVIATACNCEVSRISRETELDTVGLDSLSIASIAAHFCSRYQCDMTEENMLDLFRARTVAELLTVLCAVTSREPLTQ